ncbi:MAG: hypothetical protein IJI23_08250 [Lachnospiraceae bacterium]|nr:hypothetical protein [Lachnospiraceae bacterium]
MTKKTVCYVAVLVLSVALIGCKGQAKPEDVPASEVLLGGWEMADHEAGDLPEDAQKAFDAAKDKLSDGEYTPVSLLATQVVAGKNYCILCQVKPKDATEQKWTLVYIYADLQGNAEIMNTYDLYIAQHSMPKE